MPEPPADTPSPRRHYPGGTVDLRLFDPRERLGLLEMTLEALRPGEDLLVVFGEAPQRLPAHLEARYPGRFQWLPVAEGPPVWEVCIRSLAATG